jgi:cell division transport system permease protein
MLLFVHFDIPLHKDDISRVLPWVMGLNTLLLALLLGFIFSLNQYLESIAMHNSHMFDVQVSHRAEGMDAAKKLVHDVLKAEPEIASVKEYQPPELLQTLEPWLGKAVSGDVLPLPVLFEVTIKDSASIDLSLLEKTLSEKVDGVVVNHREAWLKDFTLFIHNIRYVALGLMMGMLAITLLVVGLLSKTEVLLHRKVVTLLHAIGAKDAYITRQFRAHVFMQTLKGAVIGGVLAGACFFIVSNPAVAKLNLLPHIAFTQLHVALFAGLPVLIAWVAFQTSHVVTNSILKPMY